MTWGCIGWYLSIDLPRVLQRLTYHQDPPILCQNETTPRGTKIRPMPRGTGFNRYASKPNKKPCNGSVGVDWHYYAALWGCGDGGPGAGYWHLVCWLAFDVQAHGLGLSGAGGCLVCWMGIGSWGGASGCWRWVLVGVWCVGIVDNHLFIP